MSLPSGPPSDLPPTIGRYRIQARVSTDVRDDVYSGFDPMIERPVAIKVFRLPEDAAAVAPIRETFYREMQRVGALIHPNIVTLYDAGELPGALFIASELVEGASLGERLAASASLELPMRVSMLVQMADALEYARTQDAPHLNLKPSQVFIGSDFTLKLSGFGVAPVLDAIGRTRPERRPAASRYLAPERAAGEAGDARSDVYSLAQLALDILAGDGADHQRATWSADEIPAPAAALSSAGIDIERWREVFRRALAPRPADRYDSALSLKFELVLLLGVDEHHALSSWETARALGQLAPLVGSGPVGIPVEEAATVLADPGMHLRAPLDFPLDEPNTGAHDTVLAASGDQIRNPLAAPDAETQTMIANPADETPTIGSGDEETKPALPKRR